MKSTKLKGKALNLNGETYPAIIWANLLALVIQKVDNKIHPINLQPCGYIIQFFSLVFISWIVNYSVDCATIQNMSNRGLEDSFIYGWRGQSALRALISFQWPRHKILIEKLQFLKRHSRIHLKKTIYGIFHKRICVRTLFTQELLTYQRKLINKWVQFAEWDSHTTTSNA